MADADDGVHRLKDILVEEVSLVDRAANKRRFLLVKREGGEMSELRSNGRGGFTRVSKADDDEEVEQRRKAIEASANEEAVKAGKKPPFPGAAKPFGAAKEPPKPPEPPGGDDEEKAKAKKAEEDEENEKARKVLEAAGLAGAAKRVFANQGDSEDERKRRATKVDAEGMALANEVAKLADELGKVSEAIKAEEADEPSDVHMKKILAMHKSLGGMCDKYAKRVGKRDVQKIGAKMAGARLMSFKAAMDTLQSILAELLETPAKVKDHDADPGDPQKAGAGYSANNPSGAPTNAMGQAAVKAMEDRVAKMLEEVVAPLAELAKAQSSKIAKLEKGIVGSNAMSVQGRRQPQTADAWPMDMARSVKVAKNGEKEESFLDP